MGDGKLNPFVYWAQTESHISLKIDLKNVTSPEVHLNEDELEFIASGFGARGQNEYRFVLEFYSAINPKESQYRVCDRQVDFNIKKMNTESWPRLIQNSQKPVWLKIDFDKWKPDAEDDEPEEIEKEFYDGNKDFYEKWREERNQLHRSNPLTVQNFRKIYLCLYCIFQFIGFSYVFCSLTLQYFKHGPEILENAYDFVGRPMKFVQTLQLMEIVHLMLKYTKGSLRESVLQVMGRFIMLFIMIDGEPRIQTKPVIFYLFCTWSLVELVRYPYYMFRLLKIEVDFISWLRYTIWIPLYPLGFLCEGVVILRNIPHFEETRKFSMSLPNKWNFSFDLPSLMRIYLLFMLFPIMYTMMNHMYYRRKKKLGSNQRRLKND